MATISVIPTYRAGLATPRLSTWNRFALSAKTWWYNVTTHSEIAQLLCCVDATEVDNYLEDCSVREDVRAAMREQVGYNSLPTCVSAVLVDVRRNADYVMDNSEPIYRKTVRDWDQFFEQNKLDIDAPRHDILGCLAKPQPVLVVPKFAAAVTLHIKAKLGVLAKNESNLLLVQRKYLEICRDHNVRDCDAAAHLQVVLNAYFTEDVFERIAKTRLRAPAWLRVFEEKERAATLESC